MQGALSILAPALRAQVALLLQHPWNVGQLCKLVSHEKWSEPIHNSRYQALVDSSVARDRVRLLCLQNSHSGAWLNICPSAAAGLRLGNPEFNVVSGWDMKSYLKAFGIVLYVVQLNNSF